jgi:hypothetical protein
MKQFNVGGPPRNLLPKINQICTFSIWLLVTLPGSLSAKAGYPRKSSFQIPMLIGQAMKLRKPFHEPKILDIVRRILLPSDWVVERSRSGSLLTGAVAHGLIVYLNDDLRKPSAIRAEDSELVLLARPPNKAGATGGGTDRHYKAATKKQPNSGSSK